MNPFPSPSAPPAPLGATAGVVIPPPGVVHPAPVFRAIGMDDLRLRAQAQPGWLWQAYLAPGNVTLLTSQWKSGKTTLVAVLLARMKTGGTLAGLPVRPGRAVVVSDEPESHWVERGRKLDLDGHVKWLCRPFRGRPRREEWLALVDYLATLVQEQRLDLVVIDSLASFLSGNSENLAGAMLDVLLPLQRLTALGVSVLILHHPKQGEAIPGQAARGSGALPGFVDIQIEMFWYDRATEDDRRRRLVAYSRHTETPRRLVIELTADGTDYLGHGDLRADGSEQGWDVLRGVLEDARKRLTRRQLLEQWPQDYPKPEESTLWQWLDRAVSDGRVKRDGSGRKNSPFRYWLPSKEEEWNRDPFHPDNLAAWGLPAPNFDFGETSGKPRPRAEGT